jgi:hypothetical protein
VVLLDVFRKRLDFPDLKRAVIDLRHRNRADRVIMEEAGSGYALYRTCGIPVKPG